MALNGSGRYLDGSGRYPDGSGWHLMVRMALDGIRMVSRQYPDGIQIALDGSGWHRAEDTLYRYVIHKSVPNPNP